MNQPQYQIRSRHQPSASSDQSYVHRLGTVVPEEVINLSVLMESETQTEARSELPEISDPSLRLSPLDSKLQPISLNPDLSMPCLDCEVDSAIETMSGVFTLPRRKPDPVETPIRTLVGKSPGVIIANPPPCGFKSEPSRDSDRIRSRSQDEVLTYTKGLEHDSTGAVLPASLSGLPALLQRPSALQFRRPLIRFDSIPDSIPTFPVLNSDAMGAQMATLYAMSLFRDHPFNQWVGSELVRICCRSLNQFQARALIKGQHLPQNLFRCSQRMIGPYISQFLLRSDGTEPQNYITSVEGSNFMGTWGTVLSGVNGRADISAKVPWRPMPRAILTGRDLAWVVHSEDGLAPLRHACGLLRAWKVPPNLEVRWLDLELILAAVAQRALGVADSIKWDCRVPRPEEYGLRIERGYRTGTVSSEISPALLSNEILTTIRSRQHNHFLTQVYPEGAPLSPAYPSGEAAIAGAGVTVLKFFYSTATPLPVYEPTSDGLSLVLTPKETTVGAELDQLGFNLGLGRCWAGVNYPIDIIEGLKLGEAVALRYLAKRLGHLGPIRIEQFNGHAILIGTGEK